MKHFKIGLRLESLDLPLCKALTEASRMAVPACRSTRLLYPRRRRTGVYNKLW